MAASGTPAFIVEDFAPNMPNVDPDEGTKQQCPLCNKSRKLKEMRDHVGRHILLRSRGIEEDNLVKTVSLPRLRLMFNTDSCARSVTILADSAVAISAAPALWLPAPSDRSNRTVHFIAHSSTAQPRSRQKTPRAPMSRLHVLTARRQFGNTTQSTTSCLGTTPFSTAPASILVLSSRFNSAKRRRRRWVSLMRS